MTTKIFLLATITSVSLTVFAQTTEKEKNLRTQSADTTQGWRKGGILAINLAQTSLTNWAAGGDNSISINSLLSVFANYKKEKSAWDNSLDLGYGLLKQGKNAKFIKTDDKIDLLSKYGRQAFSNHWYYAGLLNFKTQMTPGYNYPNDSIKISTLFAPAYIIGAIGLDYKPISYFSLFIAPITTKITLVNDQTLANAGSFGVEKATYDTLGNVLTKGKKSRIELGGYLRLIFSKNDFKNEFLKNVSFTTKLDLFSNYLYHPENIDISWETLIALKVNKYISVNLTTHLLYDNDINIIIDTNGDGKPDVLGPRTQFKEILGVGFSYKF
ncbi:MAG: DUF3078 domain-containing protein [Bacteroidia bacterium]|nr:DUF3078 domain-containing protein [Bacteroidia bacterium]